jgi:ABC-type polysaccharide/polyol phosphate export permease
MVVPPLAMAVIFSTLRQAQIVNVPMGNHTMPYVLFALIGTTLWGIFTQVSTTATGSIINAGSLVSKIYFPREVLVLSAVGTVLITSLVRIGMVIVTFVLFRYVPHWQALFIPVVLLPLLALALGIGLILAPLNAMLHDVGRLLEFVLQFGLFLTPIVYPTPALGDVTTPWQSALWWLHNLNPVSHYINAVHSLIETGTVVVYPGLVVSSALGFLVLLVGWRFFHICEPLMAERL